MPRLYPNQIYDLFNGRYFRGKLPKVVVRWAAFGTDCIGKTVFKADTKEPLCIFLNSHYRKSNVIWLGTLLHEMVHVELRYRKIKDHGYVFNRRIKELVNVGAFKDLI